MPSQIRIPVFITVISTFVTIVDYAMKAYAPSLSRSLGVFVPLIVVNCIVMGRAEAFASKNGVLASLMDGIGMSIGFTVVITLIGAHPRAARRGHALRLRRSCRRATSPSSSSSCPRARSW